MAKLEEPVRHKAFKVSFDKFPAEIQQAITMPAEQRSSMQWFMYYKAQPYFHTTKQDIESGLKAEDRVVVAGVLRAIPGQKVDPQMQTASAQ